MTLFGWIILIVLAITVLILSISLVLVIKKAKYFSKKSRELIIFVIDMYVQYGEEIGITSEDKHDALVKELNKLRKKLE